jgi:hypothetical protein
MSGFFVVQGSDDGGSQLKEMCCKSMNTMKKLIGAVIG